MMLCEVLPYVENNIVTVRTLTPNRASSESAFTIHDGKVKHYRKNISLASCMDFNVYRITAASKGYVTIYIEQ